MTNKKLGLLLLPLLPLTAIGIVEVASSIMPPKHGPLPPHRIACSLQRRR